MPFPVSNSVAKPIANPIIAMRPFKTSEKIVKPGLDSVFFMIRRLQLKGFGSGVNLLVN